MNAGQLVELVEMLKAEEIAAALTRMAVAHERIAQELSMIREALTRPPALSQEGALTRFADALAKAQRVPQVASLWVRAEAGFEVATRGRAWAGAIARVREIGSFKSADEAETALKRAVAAKAPT